MNEIVRSVAEAADSESPRSERGRISAEIVRRARGYRWVGIYDAGDEEISLIADAGSTARDEAIRRQTTAIRKGVAVIPVLGAESGIAIGTMEVESDDALSEEDRSFLDECAAALRPLYD